MSAPARRELVRQMIDQGLSERRSLAVADISASAYRYAPRPDRNGDLRQRIVALAQRHKRYGVGMIVRDPRRQDGQAAHISVRYGSLKVVNQMRL